LTEKKTDTAFIPFYITSTLRL